MDGSNLTEEQRTYLRQRDGVLSRGQYTVTPHEIYRDVLPALAAKYDGRTARDAVTLWAYLHAHVNGQASGGAYLWAYPTVEQIVRDTGMKRNRVKPLADVLEAEGLVKMRTVPWRGRAKKMYMPLYGRTGER